MARVLLLSATPPDDEDEEHLAPLRDLQTRAARDRFRAHAVTSDAEAADVILFVESYGAGWHFERVRCHTLMRKYREKCFLFSSNTFVIPFLPGIYTAIEKQWASRRTVGGFYLGTPQNELRTFTHPTADLPQLYSFVGSLRNAPVRRELAKLDHPRGFIQDTAAEYERVLQRAIQPEERRNYYRRYADATKRSKFVLCPRGLSASSVRLFETMEMGRVPVILSDGWVEPPGPAWPSFSIRVPENEWVGIPEILEQREREAPAMGELARATWLEWFSEEAAFHRVVEWCLAIKEQRILPEELARFTAYLHYLQPFQFRRAVGDKIRSLRGRPQL